MCNLKITKVAKTQKLFIVLLFTALLLFSLNLGITEAATEISITINGNLLETDVAPVIIDGRTMVPMRVIFEALGAEVHWDGDKDKITGIRGNTVVVLFLERDIAQVNGELEYLDVPPTLVNSRTMVPTRFIAESLGAEVSWIHDTRTVTIKLDLDSSTPYMPVLAPTEQADSTLTTQEIVSLIQPATVLIETNRGQGSGFIVHRSYEKIIEDAAEAGVDMSWLRETGLQSHLVTNAHVVRGSRWINFTTTTGETFSAEISKLNNTGDIAILHFETSKEFPSIPFNILGTISYDDIVIGEDVIAFGNPLGFTHTVTRGIVSAKRQLHLVSETAEAVNVIQHDAAIGPGSSGGLLVNSKGKLIGINTAGSVHDRGFNFAIPLDFYLWLVGGEEYNKNDDFYSWNAEFKANDILATIFNISDNIVDSTTPFGRLSIIENDMLPYLYFIKQGLSTYYPKYSEVQSINRAFLNFINDSIDYNETYAFMTRNPAYLNNYELARLSNNVSNALDSWMFEMERVANRLGY